MEDGMSHVFGYSLAGFGAGSLSRAALRKTDVRAGDCVVVRTRNSVYALHATGDGRFIVSGGWFARKGKDGVRTSVNGCTLGGSIIKVDVVAARGFCIEFSNRLITSPVQSFVIFPFGSTN